MEEWKASARDLAHDVVLAGNIASGMLDRGQVAMVSPADQLTTAALHIKEWQRHNQCSELRMGSRFIKLADEAGEVADTYQLAVSDPRKAYLPDLDTQVSGMNMRFVQLLSDLTPTEST